MTVQDEVRALLAEATPPMDVWDAAALNGLRALQARAPELLAELCDQLDKAEAKAANAVAAIGDINVELQGEREDHGAQIARAEKAEAAIERVRALAEYARNSGESVSLRGLFLALREEA